MIPANPPEDLGDLIYDGDSIEIGDFTLTLKIEPDMDTSINDFDCYGAVEWSRGRPDTFDGGSRILVRDRHSDLWWQPPADTTEEQNIELLGIVSELIERGFSMVGLMLYQTLTDSMGHEHEVPVESTWLGGVDTTDDQEFLSGTIEDLYDDLASLVNEDPS